MGGAISPTCAATGSAIIFTEPATCSIPVFTIGQQISETVRPPHRQERRRRDEAPPRFSSEMVRISLAGAAAESLSARMVGLAMRQAAP